MVNQRESEYTKILETISNFEKTGTSQIIYVAGVPGCGKTLTITSALSFKCKNFVHVNCSKLKPRTEIFNRILSKLHCSKKQRRKNTLNDLIVHLKSCKQLHAIFIDEVDLLLTKKQQILYNLFEIPFVENAKLLLILAANTMNLAEKMFDAKICSRMGSNRVYFKPYTSEQLQKIAGSELKNKSGLNEIISKKVACLGGDVRRMNKILREINKKGVVCIEDVEEVIRDMFNPIFVVFLQNLTFKQKLIVFLMKSSKKYSFRELYEVMETYNKIRELGNIEYFMFLDNVVELGRLGILKVDELKKIVTRVYFEDEIESALKDDFEYKIISGKMAKE